MHIDDIDSRQHVAYLVTIRGQDRGCMFGDVVECEMTLNDRERIVGSACLDEPSDSPPGWASGQRQGDLTPVVDRTVRRLRDHK